MGGGGRAKRTTEHGITELCLLVCTYCVEVLPGPLCAINLLIQLLSHDMLSISIVQVGQVHCGQEILYMLVPSINT